MLLHIVN